MNGDDYYMSKDGRASFHSAIAAAHFYEDRFIEIQATYLIMAIARTKQDAAGIRFCLDQFDLLCSEVVGLHGDPRDYPPKEEGAPKDEDRR